MQTVQLNNAALNNVLKDVCRLSESAGLSQVTKREVFHRVMIQAKREYEFQQTHGLPVYLVGAENIDSQLHLLDLVYARRQISFNEYLSERERLVNIAEITLSDGVQAA